MVPLGGDLIVVHFMGVFSPIYGIRKKERKREDGRTGPLQGLSRAEQPSPSTVICKYVIYLRNERVIHGIIVTIIVFIYESMLLIRLKLQH